MLTPTQATSDDDDDHGNHEVVLGATKQMHDFQIRRNNILSFIGWVGVWLHVFYATTVEIQKISLLFNGMDAMNMAAFICV